MAKTASLKGKQIYFTNNTDKGILTPELVLSPEDREAQREANRQKALKDKEMQEQREYEIAVEQFKHFVNDGNEIERFKSYSIYNGNVLVKIFRILYRTMENGKTESGLIVPTEAYNRITNIAKVILSDDERYTVGDLVILPNSILGVKENPKYAEVVAGLKQRPIPEGLPALEDVPPIISKLSEWEKFMFPADKFRVTDEDMLCYLIPSEFIKAKYNG